MANGIATPELVVAMARAGMLGFYGAAGLAAHKVEAALDVIEAALGPDGPSWGANLIHSPNEPDLEAAVVDLYLRRGVRRVSASAYMGLTAPIVRYAVSGLRAGPGGRVVRSRHVFAKISRPEVARHFMSPAPAAILEKLVAQGAITSQEAQLAARVPIAEDIIVESDSGGHTDNRPLGALFPVIQALRDGLALKHGFGRHIRVGAAGGLGAPQSVASAFSLGAAFVLTGSINQGAVESGLSPEGRQMLAQAGLADVEMAAAADMFELGVKLQVLKRGTMFAGRANSLYDIYRKYESLEAIPAPEKARLEKSVLGTSVKQVWDDTRRFWEARDPREVSRATEDPKHKMALCFRWYLGKSSRWAIEGLTSRRLDYQIWCGPAMGAFNEWVKGSCLDPPEARSAPQIALNLMEGAARITRAQQLRTYGVPVPDAAFNFVPRPLA
jgi:PfaD family protein